MFGNPVTLLSGLGTFVVIAGVLLYTKAQEYDDRTQSANLLQRRIRAIWKVVYLMVPVSLCDYYLNNCD